MSKLDFHPTSFLKRVAATWVDFVLLVGLYIILGFLSNRMFLKDAYPPATGMQLYSERDFDVFWFFVQMTGILVSGYLYVSYRFFKGTIGQHLTNIRLISEEGEELSLAHVIRRIFIVLFRLFLIAIPGPIVALIYFSISLQILNEALSLTLLLAVVLGFFYRSFTKYREGNTQSLVDQFSRTRFIDMSKNKQNQAGDDNSE